MTGEEIDVQAREIEARANKALAALPRNGNWHAALLEITGGEWEWVDISTHDSPMQVAIGRYLGNA